MEEKRRPDSRSRKRALLKKRRRRKRRFLFIFLGFILLLVLLFIYFQRNVTRVLISISEATMRSCTTIAVNDAVYYTLSDEMRYDDLVTVTRDEDGDIVSIYDIEFEYQR